jgi:hypothetical protein
MPIETTITAGKPARNATVIAAWIIIGLAAFMEIIFSAVAMAPRFASVLRNPQPDQQPAQQQEPPPAPAPSVTQEIVNAPRIPATKSPVLAESDLPARQPPPDAATPNGAVLQIVSDRLESTGQGSKKLQITIKGDKRQQIQVPEVKVQVYFYDEENGEIVPSKAQVTSTWLSLPVDWKKDIPELLEVNYLPDGVDNSIRFAGYVVAIYYKGDLQDCRANPPRLRKLFEPKYFIGNDEP